MKKYNPQTIEKKWQKYWEQEDLATTPDKTEGKENYYTLFEFPYPSGNLHMGHWYAFAVPDTFVRYMRMQGKYNVMYPIGFDAFGLPAENAAIKRNLQPSDWTYENIAYMSKQLKSMGTMLDWSRQVITSDPEYYKWTQWLFLQFYKKGLAYRARTVVNWCPKDNTVLANEQVIQKAVNGVVMNICDRCGTEVEPKNLEQWMFKITQYADALVDDLEKVDWPESTKQAQRNWIGRSEGAEIDFQIADSDSKITIFTTRADTIFAGTFLILAPEHPLVNELKRHVANWQEVVAYVEESKKKTERERLMDAKEKNGVELRGVKAVNPANGELISVWLADFVLANYGTGAVFADAHDARDFEFAKKYNIPLKTVLRPSDREDDSNIRNLQECFEGEGILYDSGEFTDLHSSEARPKIINWLISKNVATLKRNYRLRDWILSRQRYWGCPIPMIKCVDCGYQPVPEDQLPVVLPKLEDYKPSPDGRSPLAKATEWVQVKCPKCGNDAERETDTMDTFVDSSWYFIRYTDPKNDNEIARKELQKAWLPVDTYIGGAEHNTMHLLYSRFYTKAMHDLGIIDIDEPFLKRINHGVILGPDGQKMSKSKGNVIDPDELVKEFGADTVRMYLAFMAPYDQGGPWDPKGINGIARFLNRAWQFVHDYEKNNDRELFSVSVLHNAIKKIGEDIREFHFNTGVSELMKLLNHLESHKVDVATVELFLKLLAPFAPHIAEELWQEVLDHKDSIHTQLWPEFDTTLLQDSSVTVVVQISGKTRGFLVVPFDTDQQAVEVLVRADEKLAKYLAEVSVNKIIFVANKLINFVL